jgi:hypothetical protein
VRGRSSHPPRSHAAEDCKAPRAMRCHGTLWSVVRGSGVARVLEGEGQKWPRKRGAWRAAVPARGALLWRIGHVRTVVYEQRTLPLGVDELGVASTQRQDRVRQVLPWVISFSLEAAGNRASRVLASQRFFGGIFSGCSGVRPTRNREHLARTWAERINNVIPNAERVGYAGRNIQQTMTD